MPEKSHEGLYRKGGRFEQICFTVIPKRKVKTWCVGNKGGTVYRFQGRYCCCFGAGNHPVAFVNSINEQDRLGRVEMWCIIWACTAGCTSLKMCKGELIAGKVSGIIWWKISPAVVLQHPQHPWNAAAEGYFYFFPFLTASQQKVHRKIPPKCHVTVWYWAAFNWEVLGCERFQEMELSFPICSHNYLDMGSLIIQIYLLWASQGQIASLISWKRE